ncbi:MAG: DEAD/DEAH box helicase [Elusimicrobiota bacterium]|nr:DEAD/DEAH box helicase [Elusimicrobiota bacterium]
MAQQARLIVENGTLKITAPARSPIHQGTHYIFLVNVLGLEPILKPEPGFQIQLGPSKQALIRQLVDYFHEAGIKLSLEGTAGEISRRLESDEQALEAARKAGDGLKRAPPRTERFQIPGFKRELKTYQIPAVQHAVSVANAANFSVPGSGKTTITLAAYAIMKAQGAVDKLAVIGPRACFMPWEDEYEGCFGEQPESIRISGSRARRKGLFRKADSAELVLLTYQMASNDADDVAAFLQRNRCLLVLDESHYIKRLEGGTWASALLDLAPFASRRLILSGTPAPNSLLDLWSQFAFLWPNPPLLGRRDHFRFKVDQHGSEAEQIKRTLRPFFWRVRKADLKLPLPTFHRVDVPMRPYQRRIYDAIGAKVLRDVVKAPSDRSKLRLWRKAKIVRLLQAASNPSLLTEYSTEFRIPPLDATGLPIDQLVEQYSKFEVPAKLDYAEKLVRRLVKKGEKVLLWSTFVHNIKTLEARLRDLKPLSIFGEVPKDDDENEEYNRELIIRQFKTPDGPPILIANPGACAESVSLHKICKHAVYLDRTFNGAQYLQSLDRIHRVGLGPKEHVHYYIIQATDSVDSVVDQRLEEKKLRMLHLLEDELPVMSLDVSEDEVSDEDDEGADFAAMVVELKKEFSRAHS